MTMREEVKEAMADAAFKRNCPDTAAAIRDERWGAGFPCDSHMLALAKAVLIVIDQYEEVEVRECKDLKVAPLLTPCHWLRLPDCGSQTEDRYQIATYTILRRRKQKPDVPELARRAVKAYDNGPPSAVHRTMCALAEALDE